MKPHVDARLTCATKPARCRYNDLWRARSNPPARFWYAGHMMTVLNAARRKAMPQSEFGMPGKRFPENDPIHQRLAISGATRSENAGNISASTAAKIKAEARRKLGISKGSK